MPDYTTPYNIQYPIAGDFIKEDSVEAKLAADMKALATSAAAAVGSEGERAESAAAAKAKTYTDTYAALKTDPGIPNVAAGTDDTYAEVVVDETGRISEATRSDGTKVIPSLAVSRVESPEDTTLVKDVAGFREVTLDSEGRITRGTRTDGTQYVPRLEVDSLKISGEVSNGAPIDVIVVAGQSNATERSTLPASTVTASSPWVLEWNSGAGLMQESPADEVDWLGNGFARQYVIDNPGRRVLLVATASGSSGFSSTSLDPAPEGYHTSSGGTWDRTLTSDPLNLYSRMIDRYEAAKAAAETTGADVSLVAMLWSQGEEDRLMGAAYEPAFDDFLTAARTDLGDTDLPVIIGSLTPETIDADSDGLLIDLIHRDTARRVERTSYVWGPANRIEYANDRLHYSPQGQRERGYMFATDGLYRARLNLAAGAPVQPANLTAVRDRADWVIRWDQAPSRATAYTLETSIDLGETWTAAALAGPLVNYHRITATSGPVMARVSTVNETGTTDPTYPITFA